ncbi:ABC1-domain-containing protein [Xylaria sp. CBS 124048]|nr:ABC1-domain-containing protein [Xylaria sp. CBS 124048]
MGFADIILDLAAVAKASRSVASRHWQLRGKQIDGYSRTSSIIRSFQKYEKDTDGKSDSPTTRVTEDTPRGSQQQQSDADTPVQAGPVNGTGLGAAVEDSYKTPTPDAQTKIVQNEPFGYAATQRHIAAQPDYGTVLAQLRKERSNRTDHFYESSSGERSNVHDGVQPDIDLGIFHTKRGAQILDAQKYASEQPQPKVPPSKPSWFKDFGHNEQQKQYEGRGEKHLSFTSKASGKESLPFAERLESRNGEGLEVSSSGYRTEVDSKKVGEAKLNQPSASPISNHQEFGTQRVEEDHAQTVKDVYSGNELDSVRQLETRTSPSSDPLATTRALRESTVPATRLSRLWNYGGLAAGMLGGALSEGISRGLGGGGQGSVVFNANNMERLVAKLSRMRGAALKLGQMMSFQDSKMLPGPIQEILQRVQDRADYMPAWQRDRVLVASLGPEWRSLFGEFEDTPIAAASIGQVHRATLKSGEKVAVKIQFPGVAESINSDLDNISILLRGSMILPKGLYLNKTIENARTELGWECDYERELECGKRYKELLSDEGDVFAVPEIYPHASGKHVLTMQFMEGVGVTRVASFTQAQRDWIGTQILRLCLREISEFRFMQTDPNWTNFLYNATTNKLELLDFGASREFPALFVAQYITLLAAASRADRETVLDYSQRLGYLTGHESAAMVDAHVASILTLAEPFLQSAPELYDFANQTITERVRDLIPVMVRERLSPPPEETYSLHRKLSGAFLLCARLGSRVKCRELFQMALEKADLEIVRT